MGRTDREAGLSVKCTRHNSYVERDKHCSTRLRHTGGSKSVCDSPNFMVVRIEMVNRDTAMDKVDENTCRK
jgi:hypothetical protein